MTKKQLEKKWSSRVKKGTFDFTEVIGVEYATKEIAFIYSIKGNIFGFSTVLADKEQIKHNIKVIKQGQKNLTYQYKVLTNYLKIHSNE